jgi:hypothetical protein
MEGSIIMRLIMEIKRNRFRKKKKMCKLKLPFWLFWDWIILTMLRRI